jgi:DNA-binding transcriptional LysR family regulator
MRMSHIEVCHAVLVTGTVTGAARMLHVTQPAVTKLLQSAENRLGFKLFNRDRNRLVPTAEALAMQAELAEIAARMQRLRDLAQAMRSDQSALLRVDCVPSIAGALLAPAMRRVAGANRKVACHLEVHAHGAIHERLLRRQCDIGFALAGLPNPAVIEETIAFGHEVCVAPAATFAAGKAAVSRQDLMRCRVLRVPQAHHPSGSVLHEPVPAGGASPASITVTTHMLALRLAEQGLGVAVVDAFTAASADRRLVQVLPMAPQTPVELKWMRRIDAPLSLPARRFTQAMAAAAKEAAMSVMAVPPASAPPGRLRAQARGRSSATRCGGAALKHEDLAWSAADQ